MIPENDSLKANLVTLRREEKDEEKSEEDRSREDQESIQQRSSDFLPRGVLREASEKTRRESKGSERCEIPQIGMKTRSFTDPRWLRVRKDGEKDELALLLSPQQNHFHIH